MIVATCIFLTFWDQLDLFITCQIKIELKPQWNLIVMKKEKRHNSKTYTLVEFHDFHISLLTSLSFKEI